MEERILIGGLGGQGVLVIGKVLSHACVLEGKEIVYMEEYGDSVRGGVVSCSLIVSSESIASPIIEEPTMGIALSPHFLEVFESQLGQKGLLIVNSSLVSQRPYRRDLILLEIPATELASEMGNSLLSNMIILGGLIGCTGICHLETSFQGIERTLPEHRRSMISSNIKGIKRGLEYYLSRNPKENGTFSDSSG
jgi:2-oxoglutarate ferredoxin oxidoreductase subunit gamma